ncbi:MULTISPECIES: hypothetical protein [Actinomycetes]|uniref:Uncharacterized protein n=1 Tax=Trueperella pyogenes TaxID=1661 RepID=A0A380MEE4_9ACTO|nr:MULTISPECIES: hypothetical protein [Actinomycetes]AWG04916.1 hypothetical protein DC090_03670 [Trueperella pyogenes]AWG17336.1 hypothetical protein DDE06_05600 [Trueperella pyogenes]AZR05794.1 hypothetical protein EBQ11_08200 [Trueperella pyogenes]AZR07878.1 hypothetical protein EBQ10_07535 [Trueperella pyogenes]SUO88189.1 Uncharacterised protein [Trueperella pyogenes]
MIQHRLKLHIAKDIPEDPGVVATKIVSIRERLWRFLLGKRRQVTLVVPGDSVRQIDITETEDDLMALARAVGVTRSGGDAA